MTALSLLKLAGVFQAVVRHGGISAAARALGRSPPAVHYDLHRFQREFGTQLVERVGRSIRATPEGQLVYETLERGLQELDRVREHLLLGSGALLPLRLGSVSSFGRFRIVPPLLRELPRERPLVLRMAAHDDLLALLQSGEIDLMITYRPVTSVPVESMSIAAEELVLVAPVAEIGAYSTLVALGAATWIAYDEHEYVFARWFEAVHRQQPPQLKILDRMEELDEAIAAVSAGRGLTIIPADACRGHTDLATAAPVQNTIFLCGTGSRLRSDDANLVAAAARSSMKDILLRPR
jgi:DNA-binding transcriptional LysR family regulator